MMMLLLLEIVKIVMVKNVGIRDGGNCDSGGNNGGGCGNSEGGDISGVGGSSSVLEMMVMLKNSYHGNGVNVGGNGVCSVGRSGGGGDVDGWWQWWR